MRALDTKRDCGFHQVVSFIAFETHVNHGIGSRFVSRLQTFRTHYDNVFATSCLSSVNSLLEVIDEYNYEIRYETVGSFGSRSQAVNYIDNNPLFPIHVYGDFCLEVVSPSFDDAPTFSFYPEDYDKVYYLFEFHEYYSISHDTYTLTKKIYKRVVTTADLSQSIIDWCKIQKKWSDLNA